MNALEKILNVFSLYRMPQIAGDQFEEKGKDIFLRKVEAFVSQGQPIEFSMLGYPFKSINDRDKTIGKLPDLGELKSLENFASFDADIKEIYSPGINVSIISDGLIFNDLMDVSDATVDKYEEIAKDMAAVAPIDWYDMRDFYPRELSTMSMREKVMEQFGITSEVLQYRILNNSDVNTLYKGMITFMGGDLAVRPYPSGNQLHKAAKIMAREMMFRNEAYSALIRENFKDHIRLSMHPSVNDGTKFSFQLIRSPKARHSPWHSALLIEKDGTLATIHRKDAEGKNYELVNKDGRPFYFQEV